MKTEFESDQATARLGEAMKKAATLVIPIESDVPVREGYATFPSRSGDGYEFVALEPK